MQAIGSTDATVPGFESWGRLTLDSAMSGMALMTVGAGDPMVFYTALGERLRIDGTGLVGIGDSSPDTELEVASTGITELHVKSDSDNNSADTDVFIRFQIDTDTDKGIVGYNQGIDRFVMGYASAADIVVDTNGDVGIGTTNPAARLHVEDTIGTALTAAFKLTDTENSSGFFDLTDFTSAASAFIPTINAQSAGTDGYGLGIIGSILTANDVLDAAGAAIVFDARESDSSALEAANLFAWRSFGTVQMVMDKDGHVGIGVSAPGALLDVTDTSGVGAEIEVAQFNLTGAGAQLPAIVLQSNSTDGLRLTHSAAFVRAFIDHNYASATSLGFGVRGSELMTILNTGNVGIGTTSPSNIFHIQSAISTVYADAVPSVANTLLAIANIQVAETINDQAQIQFSVNGGTFNRVGSIGLIAESVSNRKGALVFATDNGVTRPEAMRITGDADVGIGTTSPDAKLEVENAVAASTDNFMLLLHNPTTASDVRAGMEFSVNIPGSAGAKIGVANDGATGGDMSFITRTSSTDTTRMFIDASAARIGIGTTTPTVTLDIESAAVNPQINISHTGATGSVGTLRIDGYRSVTNNIAHIDFFNDFPNVTNARIVAISDDADAAGDNDGRIYLQTANAGTLATAVYIDKNQQVGVGSSSAPSRDLHIRDTMRLEPRSAAPSSGAAGDLYFDSDSNELCVHDGTSWTGLIGGGTCA